MPGEIGPFLGRGPGGPTSRDTELNLQGLHAQINEIRQNMDTTIAAAISEAGVGTASTPKSPATLTPPILNASVPPLNPLHWIQDNYPEEDPGGNGVYPVTKIRVEVGPGADRDGGEIQVLIMAMVTTAEAGPNETPYVRPVAIGPVTLQNADYGNGFLLMDAPRSGIAVGDSVACVIACAYNSAQYSETVYDTSGTNSRVYVAGVGVEAPPQLTLVKVKKGPNHYKFQVAIPDDWTYDFDKPYTGPHPINYFKEVEIWACDEDGTGAHPDDTGATGWEQQDSKGIKSIVNKIKRQIKAGITTPSLQARKFWLTVQRDQSEKLSCAFRIVDSFGQLGTWQNDSALDEGPQDLDIGTPTYVLHDNPGTQAIEYQVDVPLTWYYPAGTELGVIKNQKVIIKARKNGVTPAPTWDKTQVTIDDPTVITMGTGAHANMPMFTETITLGRRWKKGVYLDIEASITCMKDKSEDTATHVGPVGAALGAACTLDVSRSETNAYSADRYLLTLGAAELSRVFKIQVCKGSSTTWQDVYTERMQPPIDTLNPNSNPPVTTRQTFEVDLHHNDNVHPEGWFRVVMDDGVKGEWTCRTSTPAALSLTATAVLAGGAGLTVDFNCTAAGGSGVYATVEWDWTDDSAYDLSVPYASRAQAHTYPSAAAYNYRVRVTDSLGATAVATGSITTTAPPGGLTVVVNASPTDGVGPFLCEFTATPSGGVAPYHYAWVFGDGSTGGDASGPIHSYPINNSGNPIVYNAVCNVYDSTPVTPKTGSGSVAVTNNPAPTTSYSTKYPTVCANSGAGTAWSNPTYAQGPAGTDLATATLSAEDSSRELQGSVFGWALPIGAAPKEITVSVSAKGSVMNTLALSAVRIYLGATEIGAMAMSGTFPTTLTTVSLSGTLAQWGISSLTYSQVNSGDFRVALVGEAGEAGFGGTISVESMTVKIGW